MPMSRSFAAIFSGGSIAFAALLSGCGGGSGDAAPAQPASTVAPGVDILNVTPAQIESAKAMKHSAALGVLVGSKVEVRDAFAVSGPVLYTTTTDDNGQYTVTLPGYAKYSMFLVTVSGGNDWDVNDTGKRDASPTPFNGSINALVDPNDLLNGSIKVSLLSEAAYQLIGGDLSRFDASSLNTELNRVAKLLLKTSLFGAAEVSSNELLQFDATDINQRAALAFAFASLSQPVAPGTDEQSLLQKYHAGATDLNKAWLSVTSGLSGLTPTLAQEIDKSTAKLQAMISGHGRITGATLPGGAYNPGPSPYAAVLPRDGSTLSFEATETDVLYGFDSWTGCTRVVGTRCDVSMSQDMAVTARFALKTPMVKPEAASLGRIAPQDGKTGVRFNADGTATIVTVETSAIAFLQTATVGTFIQTGHVDHPTVKVLSIVAPLSTVSTQGGASVSTMTFAWQEASPLDVYDAVSIVVDSTPVAFDEVRAITLGDAVGGSVRTVLPVPDFTSSVVAASTPVTPPSWYVTLAADGQSCKGFGADAIARAALQAAWQAAPRTYPFTASALANCVSLGSFAVVGDLTDYVMGKSTGDTDLLSGRNDGTGKLAMRSPKAASPHASALNPRYAKGETIERQGETVWVAGVGLAIPLGNNLFIAAREPEPNAAPAATTGFRLVALQDSVPITSRQAIRQARSDCSMKGLGSACGLLAGIERERQGLRNVGLIPLLSSPLEVTLSKPGSNLSGTVSLNLNMDLKPKASFDWSIVSQWVEASAGANFAIKPELGLKATYGGPVESFKVPSSSKKKKFNKNNSKSKTDKNKINTSKTVITIDVGRAIPYAGAVLDLSLNLVVGVDIGGELSLEVKPTLTLEGDFGLKGRYEYHFFGSDDRDISAWFNLPVHQPGISVEAKGTLFVEPYAELNLSAGLRGVAPEVGRLFVRGGVLAQGEIATGFSYGTIFRDQQMPDVYSEGSVVKSSSKYWENCSLSTRTSNPSSCSCTADQTHQESHWYGGSYTVTDKKCVQRGTPAKVAGAIKKIPQRCVTAPELALGLYVHAKAGLEVSARKIKSPFSGWLSFINKEFTLMDKQWPIWEYPEKDDSPEAALEGCKDIN